MWKLDDPEVLRAERARKVEEAQAKADAKRLAAEKAAAKEAAARVDPRDMFKTGPYAAFDADGWPGTRLQSSAVTSKPQRDETGPKYRRPSTSPSCVP